MRSNSKQCRECGELKPLDEFYEAKTNRDGRWNKCKVCARMRQKECDDRRRDEKKLYYLDHRDDIIQSQMEYNRKRRKTNPEKIRARSSLKYAVQSGKITKPEVCNVCGGNEGRIEFHHHSYEPEHHLHGEWLCSTCHGMIHREYPDQMKRRKELLLLHGLGMLPYDPFNGDKT